MLLCYSVLLHFLKSICVYDLEFSGGQDHEAPPRDKEAEALERRKWEEAHAISRCTGRGYNMKTIQKPPVYGEISIINIWTIGDLMEFRRV